MVYCGLFIICTTYKVWVVPIKCELYIKSVGCAYKVWVVKSMYIYSVGCSYRVWVVHKKCGLTKKQEHFVPTHFNFLLRKTED